MGIHNPTGPAGIRGTATPSSGASPFGASPDAGWSPAPESAAPPGDRSTSGKPIGSLLPSASRAIGPAWPREPVPIHRPVAPPPLHSVKPHPMGHHPGFPSRTQKTALNPRRRFPTSRSTRRFQALLLLTNPPLVLPMPGLSPPWSRGQANLQRHPKPRILLLPSLSLATRRTSLQRRRTLPLPRAEGANPFAPQQSTSPDVDQASAPSSPPTFNDAENSPFAPANPAETPAGSASAKPETEAPSQGASEQPAEAAGPKSESGAPAQDPLAFGSATFGSPVGSASEEKAPARSSAPEAPEAKNGIRDAGDFEPGRSISSTGPGNDREVLSSERPHGSRFQRSGVLTVQ